MPDVEGFVLALPEQQTLGTVDVEGFVLALPDHETLHRVDVVRVAEWLNVQ